MSCQGRIAGDRAESACLELLPWLRYVSDETAEHYDAEAREDRGRVAAGDVVEIKSAAVVLASEEPGRFYLRRRQHEELLEAGGWYLFLVVTPDEREVLGYQLEAADVVDDELLPTWWDGGPGRAEYRQVRWTAVLSEEDLNHE